MRLKTNYTDIYFPSKGDHIAINDNVDTINGESELAPFLNILNEMPRPSYQQKGQGSHAHKVCQRRTLRSLCTAGLCECSRSGSVKSTLLSGRSTGKFRAAFSDSDCFRHRYYTGRSGFPDDEQQTSCAVRIYSRPLYAGTYSNSRGWPVHDIICGNPKGEIWPRGL